MFHKEQYGFRSGKGTDIAITKVNKLIGINQKYKDHNYEHRLVCRDVQKAFDKVWTQGLKYKIITIPELPLIIQKILCSYVTKRTAQIRIENFIGDKITLESSVPQGGILSPTLYILFTRDIAYLPQSERITVTSYLPMMSLKSYKISVMIERLLQTNKQARSEF